MAQDGDVDDPIKGVAYVNKHMRRCEEGAEKAITEGDLVTQAKFEGHLVKWTELLTYYLRQVHQQGKGTEDISKSAKKKRFNG